MKNNPIQVIDLFAGAGGFGLGFQMAGFDVVFSLEIDQWACNTLRENNPNQTIIQDTIQSYQTPTEIRDICPYTPEIIIGGPPCQGFSLAGPAQKDPKDPRNSLFVDFARWVEHLHPQIFVIENVKGLLSRYNTNHERVMDIIQQKFTDLGYMVEVWLLNAANYGVPQMRERIFIVGNRLGIERLGEPPETHDLENGHKAGELQPVLFEYYQRQPAINLWDAISDLPELKSNQGQEEAAYICPPQTEYQTWARGHQQILYNHVAMNHSERLVERFKHVRWGESSAKVPIEHMPRQRNGHGKLSKRAYDQNNRRLHAYKLSHTIAASFYANFIHPFQHRNITAREGARLQSFPDHYRFLGKKTTPSHKLLQREGRLEDKHLCQYNQIGNAVPPLLAKVIAKHIDKALSDVRAWTESNPKRDPSYKVSRS